MYIKPLSAIIDSHSIIHHSFADDLQLQMSFFLSFGLIPKKLMSSYAGMEECQKTNTTSKRKM